MDLFPQDRDPDASPPCRTLPLAFFLFLCLPLIIPFFLLLLLLLLLPTSKYSTYFPRLQTSLPWIIKIVWFCVFVSVPYRREPGLPGAFPVLFAPCFLFTLQRSNQNLICGVIIVFPPPTQPGPECFPSSFSYCIPCFPCDSPCLLLFLFVCSHYQFPNTVRYYPAVAPQTSSRHFVCAISLFFFHIARTQLFSHFSLHAVIRIPLFPCDGLMRMCAKQG